MELFNLIPNELVENSRDGNDKNCIYLYRQGEWVHIMDNYYYTHWCSSEFQTSINELGKIYEVFTCRLKDNNDSYDFSYYRNGILLRQYISESPNYSDVIVKINTGEKLSAELEINQIMINMDIPLIIAKSLGIELATKRENILCYEIDLNIQNSS